jgi:hypothetical protein
MTENRRLAIAAPAMKQRMTTLRSVLVFLAVASETTPFVSAAIVTMADGDVVQCLRRG